MCEHQQAQGIECEVCGKKLAVAAPSAVAVAPLAELEGTQLVGGRAPVAVAAIPDLELTRQAPTPAVAVQPVAELDTGRALAAGNVAVAPIQDMDTGRALSDGTRTAAPSGPIVCRYCRTPQASGLICERCGMRLPKLRQTAPEPAAGSGLVAAGEWTKCTKCHTHTRAGRACVSCGTAVPSAD
ncbi:MAG: hypothetical protein ABW123_11780 [Cystobacter sp.]